MKNCNKIRKSCLFILFSLLFLFAAPCVSFAVSSYEYEDLTGTITGGTNTAVAATVTYSDKGLPGDLFTVYLKLDNTFILSGKIGGVQYDIAGTYVVDYFRDESGNRIGANIDYLTGPGLIGDINFYFINGITTDGAAVMTPVPVPAAGWLLGSGLVGLVGLRRKIRK